MCGLKILLASSSPRRIGLMRSLGLDFTHTPPLVKEDEISTDPVIRVETNSLLKARSVTYEDSLIIGSDTVVYINGEILGKPVNEDDARSMLRRLSGGCNQVFSGVTIIDSSTGRALTRHTRTSVWFKDLSDEIIRDYVDSGEPLDKAGGYDIQGLGGELIDRIEGSYSNVVGLPLELLSEMLQGFGVVVR